MITFNVALHVLDVTLAIEVYIEEQSVLALLQNHVLTPTSDFEAFHWFETREKNKKFLSGCLGYHKFWFHNYILRGSEILKTFPYCIFV